MKVLELIKKGRDLRRWRTIDIRKIVSLLTEVTLVVMSSKDTGEGKFRARNDLILRNDL